MAVKTRIKFKRGLYWVQRRYLWLFWIDKAGFHVEYMAEDYRENYNWKI